MDHLITQYPLTRRYVERLSEKTGGPLESVVVSTITARGYLGVIKYFWSLKSEAVYLPVLESSGWPLLAPLEVLSMLVRARRRLIVAPDLSIREFGYLAAAVSSLRMAWGAVTGGAILFRDWLRLGRLLRAPRIPVRKADSDRVLYLKTNLWLGIQAGGSVAHTAGVIGGLLARDHEIEFASVDAPVNLPADDRLTIRAIPPQKTYVIPREFNHYRHNARFFDALLPSFGQSYGFIYQRLSLGNYAGVVLSRRLGVPLVMEYNGSENWLANNWGTPLTFKDLAMRAENACLRHAHVVVTVSEVLRDELVERGVEPDRVVVQPNGVDTDVFDPDRFTAREITTLRARYGIAPDAIVVTFVGTFGPWHGAEVFAKAIQYLVDSDPAWMDEHKLHFLFIGDGARRPVVEELTADPAISRFVTIAGLIDQAETPSHLAASDILVSPHVPNPDGSPFFGSPTKLFEYLASGRPVIGSDLNQIGEVLEGCPGPDDLSGPGRKPVNGACGILVKPENVAELASALRFLVEYPAWRKTAGRNARRRALDRYTWNHHVDAILAGLRRSWTLDAAPAEQRVRLLFNGLHSKTGGGVTYLKNLLPLIADDAGIEVHLCVHEEQKDVLPARLDNVTIHYLDFPQGFWRLQIHEQIDVPRLAREISADVTFSPANYGPLGAPNSVILLRNALSVAFVERRPLKLLYWASVYFGTFLSLLVAKRAITVSEYARRAASGSVLGVFADRLTVIPHGVSTVFTPPRKGAKRDSFLLAVSDLYVQKNLKNLILAFRRLTNDHPRLTLKIAGLPVDLDYHAELKRTIAEENMDGKVEFLGSVPSPALVELYRRCGVFVFPSTVETFGNPLVEAMACGAPIACSDTAAMPEVVGDAAVFFNPLDLDSMTAAISRLLDDADFRQALSRKAVNHARAYSWHRTAERTLSVIREAAAGD